MKHPVPFSPSETQVIFVGSRRLRVEKQAMSAPMRTALKNARAGFTLLEIMLVVVIISLLLGTAIFKMQGNVETARKVAVQADISSISSALKLYWGMNGFYPTQSQGLRALIEKPSSAPVPKHWTKSGDKLWRDPYDCEYNYVFPGKHNKDSFDLFSSGPDRQPGTGDDIGNWDDDTK